MPVELKPGWYLYENLEECRIIDIPSGTDETVHEDVEKISLFGD